MKNDKISVKRFGQDQLQKKKKKWIKPVVIGLVLTVIFAFLTLKGEDLIRSNIVKLSVDNDVNATWISLKVRPHFMTNPTSCLEYT